MSTPCLTCGACCAHYRVSFYWSEAEPSLGGTVPSELTHSVCRSLAAMNGTNQPQPRCVALEGKVGEWVSCAIYEKRPSPCSELQPAWLNGEPSPQCDKARIAHGLSPLTPDAFDEPEQSDALMPEIA